MTTELPHKWKLSWPGNFCLRCGIDDPLEAEDALVDCPVNHPEGKNCDHCVLCMGSGCVLNPNLVISPCIPEPTEV